MGKKKSKGKGKKSTKRRSRPAPESHAFLGALDPASRKFLAASTDLPTFLETAGGLTLSQRKRVVDQALTLIQDNYVHLPLKRSMHGVDPVQRLRLVRYHLDQQTNSTMEPEYEFHRKMLEIFNSVRDLHTNYMLPDPFARAIAYLPFDIEEYFENGDSHFVASHFVSGFSHPHFVPGVEITSWNGAPIGRAVDTVASRHAGSNLAARRARGIEGMTFRPLRMSLPADELWVIVGYIGLDGVERELRQDWLVSPQLSTLTGDADGSVGESASRQGIDLQVDLVRRMRQMLFAPQVVAAAARKQKVTKVRAAAGASVPSTMPDALRARSVTTASGEFGYVRIYTFSVNDPTAFIDEFIRLVGLLPQNGLILDVRGNGGGHIWASEGLLQTLTPNNVQPEPTQFTNSALNLRICKRHAQTDFELEPWVGSIAQSVETGAIYSRGFPITPEWYANDWGQRYHGPVVLITDALCYSATDIFAAGFQDHDIGTIVGTSDNTGAGGANVWTHELLRYLLQRPLPADPKSPYESLPRGTGMRVSIRRTLRVGDRAGTPVEDLGVEPDVRYDMSRNDVMNGNVDLMDFAGSVLASKTAYTFDIATQAVPAGLQVTATTSAISRVDAYLNGRPVSSQMVTDGANTFVVPAVVADDMLELNGFDGDDYVAQRKLFF